MRLRASPFLCFVLLLLGGLVVTVPAAPPEKSPAEPAAEKLRKALDQPRAVEIVNQGLHKAAEMLSQQTGISFHVDAAVQPALIPGMGLGQEPAITLHAGKVPLATQLEKALQPHGLAYTIVGDRVVITTSERAVPLALRQKVNVHLDGVSLDEALKRLARETAVNVVLDPETAKQGQKPLTLKLTDVSLEVAVRVLAASAGLNSVRLDSVLFVTTVPKAKTQREDAADFRQPLPAPPGLSGLGQFGMPGGLLGALGAIGVGGGGMFGLGGASGLAGGGMLGVGGALGIGGGALGIMGVPPQQKPKLQPKQSSVRPPVQKGQRAEVTTPEGLLVAARDKLPRVLVKTQAANDAPRTDLRPQARRVQALLALPQPDAFIKDVDDPALTLGQLLTALSIKFSRPGEKPPFYLTFEVNQAAFAAEGQNESLNIAVAEKVLRGARNISLASYLRRMLDRVAVPAELVVRGEHIEITTRKAFVEEFYPDRPKAALGRLPPLVSVAFEKRPLELVLDELSARAETYNVVLNPGVKEAKTPVTATFHNVPLDTAVWTVADMAGLKVVRKGNLLYVTGKKRARPHRP